MPRDVNRIYFESKYQSVREEINGELMTTASLTNVGTNGILMLCADVRVSSHIINIVPVAENNDELLYATPGTPIRLQKNQSGHLEITGLNKRGRGNITQYSLPITFHSTDSGTTITLSPENLTLTSTTGWYIGTVTLGDLAIVTPIGFGQTPLEALVINDAYGNFVGFAGAGGGVSNNGSGVLTIINPASASIGATSMLSFGASITTLWVTSLGDSGAGTLRTAFDYARSLRNSCVIKFTIGGTISLSSQMTKIAQTDFGSITVYGRDAPTPVIIDGASISAASQGIGVIEPHIFDFNAPNCAIVGLNAKNIPEALVRIGDGARNTYLESITVSNPDGRGDAEAVFAGGANTFGNYTVTARDINIDGQARRHAFDMPTGVWYLQSCVVSNVQTGYRMNRGTFTLYRCNVNNTASNGIYIGGGGTVSAQEVSVGNTRIDAVVMSTSSYPTPSSAAFFSCTITSAGASGAGNYHGIYVTQGSRVKVERSRVMFNEGDGIRATSNSQVDLGGGPFGSSGGNTLRGNGISTSGYDVRNSLQSSVHIFAISNTWDYLTVPDVSAYDVFGLVDISPLA